MTMYIVPSVHVWVLFLSIVGVPVCKAPTPSIQHRLSLVLDTLIILWIPTEFFLRFNKDRKGRHLAGAVRADISISTYWTMVGRTLDSGKISFVNWDTLRLTPPDENMQFHLSLISGSLGAGIP